MKRILAALAVLAILAIPAAAALYQHVYSTANAPISVTATPATTTFTDSQSNGTSAAFEARYVTVYSASTSANTCYFHLGDSSVDKTKDIALIPGAAYNLTYPRDRVTDGHAGWSSITTVCDTAQTATFHILATD